MRRITVTVKDEDIEWLQSHPEINISGLVQKCISEMRERYKKIE